MINKNKFVMIYCSLVLFSLGKKVEFEVLLLSVYSAVSITTLINICVVTTSGYKLHIILYIYRM